MKILLISDIAWGYGTLEALQKTVRAVHPSLVLVAGDIVDNKHGDFATYWREVLSFFHYLSSLGVEVAHVRGNWDRSPWYDRLSKLHLAHVHNCSYRIIQACGLRILGIPHQLTADLTAARALATVFAKPVHIVLAHSENIRRVWLFHLPTTVIATGHFDEQIAIVGGKLFISTWAYPDHFVTLNWTPRQIAVSYRYTQPAMTRRATFSARGLSWKEHPFSNSRQYTRQLEALLEARGRLIDGSADRRQLEDELLREGVLKRHIREYLARVG
jgi:predicted phosphodiesterase